MIINHNVETNVISEREPTPAEIAQANLDAAAAIAESEAKAQKDAERQALLERLNITEEEAKLLLG